jgi:bifunctional ADP-heptose synthase (sugar kinase/adenylyltransferase)
MGAILEQLAARFDLVLEAVTGFGGQIDALREEIVGQFSEVGRQVRFLSDRIAENREGVSITRADLGAEMVRIGENLGATRVEFREQLAATRLELQQQLATEAELGRQRVAEELGRAATEMRAQLNRDVTAAGDSVRKELNAFRSEIGHEIPAASAHVRAGIAESADSVIKKLDAELKVTNKALATLTRKFERFDDRLTVQSKDQDQRITKLERRATR